MQIYNVEIEFEQFWFCQYFIEVVFDYFGFVIQYMVSIVGNYLDCQKNVQSGEGGDYLE